MNAKTMNAEMRSATPAVVCTLVALAIGVLIPRSNAGIIFHATDVTSSFLGSEANLTGYTAWQIDVSTDNGDLITAVDIAFGGPFHQRIDIDFDGLPGTTPTGLPANGGGDSHLTPGAEALFAVQAAEDFNVASSPLPSSDAGSATFGVGSYLYGAWGIPGDLQSTRTSLAYLVLPDGAIDSLVYDLSIATRSGTSNQAAAFLSQGELPELPGRPVAQPIPPSAPPTAPMPTPDAAEQPHRDSTFPGEVCDDPTSEPSQPPASPSEPSVEVPAAVTADGPGNDGTGVGYDRDSVFRSAWETAETREALLRDLAAMSGDPLPEVYFTVIRPEQFILGEADFLGPLELDGGAAGEFFSGGGAHLQFSSSAKTSIPEPASGIYLAGISAWLTGRRRRRR